MNKIINILMRRDGLSYEEAKNLFFETQEEIDIALREGRSLEDVEYIIEDYLGLEPDYVIYFIMQVI